MAASVNASELNHYPPLARKIAVEHLALLQQLPVVFLAVLLREVSAYDWHFPAERKDVDDQIAYLQKMNATQLQEAMQGFAALPLSPELRQARPAIAPSDFLEKLTAHLWLVHGMDQLRSAAETYQAKMGTQIHPVVAATPRVCIVVIGKGVESSRLPLFKKLRTHGTYFTKVKAEGGLQTLTDFAIKRATNHREPYAHWYVDGGDAMPMGNDDESTHGGLVTLSYAALGGVRKSLLERMNTARSSGVVGPEDMRTLLAKLRPGELNGQTSVDPIVRHFELSLLTEGSGTQIFSTTFVQWAAREILRRAKPMTLILRYAPRQMERPMNELMLASSEVVREDPEGSLVDADMGAYYTWINLMRLADPERAVFVAWFEGHGEAMVIGPTMARGATSSANCEMSQILGWVS